jgi:hypothetical protein
MPVVEAAARAVAMKLTATKVAHACASETARGTATHATATNSACKPGTTEAAHVCGRKSSQGAATNVTAAKSTTHMSTAESAAAAHVAAASESAATAMPGGHGVRPGCHAERDDGGEENHAPSRDGLLPGR